MHSRPLSYSHAGQPAPVQSGCFAVWSPDALASKFPAGPKQGQTVYPEGRSIRDVHVWHMLVHVCRRWRTVVFAPQRRLGLKRRFSDRRSVKEMLDIWPELPRKMSNSYYFPCVSKVVECGASSTTTTMAMRADGEMSYRWRGGTQRDGAWLLGPAAPASRGWCRDEAELFVNPPLLTFFTLFCGSSRMGG